jgi:hypothetical protein
MSPSQRKTFVAIGVAAMLGIGAWWSAGRALGARESALQAAQATARAVALAEAIESLQARTAPGTDAPLSDAAFLGLLRSAMQSAGLPEQSLVDVAHPPPRRPPGASPASRQLLQTVTLQVRGASLEQLVRFVHHLTRDHPGLELYELRLDASEVPGQWDAEPIVVGYRVNPQTGS